MTLSVGLRGYPEAVLATDTITLDVPPRPTAEALVQNLASRSPRLNEALMRGDGIPRQSTKVLVDGVPVSHATRIEIDSTVTVLASLPCDG